MEDERFKKGRIKTIAHTTKAVVRETEYMTEYIRRIIMKNMDEISELCD